MKTGLVCKNTIDIFTDISCLRTIAYRSTQKGGWGPLLLWWYRALNRATTRFTQNNNWARMARATRVGQVPTVSVAKATSCWPARLASSKAVVANSQR